MGKALDTLTNSALGGLNNLVGGIGSGISNQITDSLFGDRNRRKQLEQQQKLTDIQTAAKRDLMAYEQQRIVTGKPLSGLKIGRAHV